MSRGTVLLRKEVASGEELTDSVEWGKGDFLCLMAQQI